MEIKTIPFGPGPLEKMQLWEPQAPASGTLFILHGLTEYIGRYEELTRFVTQRGWALAGFNIPGHGDALLTVDGLPRRAYCGGEGSWQDVVDMLDRALGCLKAREPQRPLVLLGFSLGSFLARAWLLQQAEPLPISKLLLLGTGDQGAGILRLVRGIVRLQCRRHGEYNSTPLVQSIAFESYNRRISNPGSPYAWLLQDTEALSAYEQDGRICKTITAGLFRELLSCMIYVRRGEKALPCKVPTVFISGREDPVGEMGKGVRRAAAKFPGSTVILVPGRHDILHDAGHEELYEKIFEFLG